MDIGCGKGEDMMKFYYVMCSFYVGIDKDADSLLSAANGAVSRYNQLRKTHPNFPKYTFVTADASVPLDKESQEKALSSMSFDNKKLMDRFFSKDPKKRVLFDRINCQDTIQFLLKDKMTWEGFTDNINNYLKEGGYRNPGGLDQIHSERESRASLGLRQQRLCQGYRQASVDG